MSKPQSINRVQSSVTRMDYFWKLIGENILTKVSPNLASSKRHFEISHNWGYFGGTFLGQLGYFSGIFGPIRLLFILTSGHTAEVGISNEFVCANSPLWQIPVPTPPTTPCYLTWRWRCHRGGRTSRTYHCWGRPATGVTATTRLTSNATYLPVRFTSPTLSLVQTIEIVVYTKREHDRKINW